MANCISRSNGSTMTRRRLGVRRWIHTTLGGIGVALLASSALAQGDDVDAELDALEAGSVPDATQDSAPEPEASAPAPAAPEPAAAAAEPEAENPEDVVEVTVDRRRKDLQDYSGVASAFSEKKLSSVGITNVRQLASMVPGMQIGVQEGNTEVYIRGVGSDNNTELGDPAVALHLDGVYVPRPRGVGSMFYDIERVEVSSGPQGTLRGRNAMGGTVNIVSKQPQMREYAADAEATFGTFRQRRYQGMVNVPLGDSVAVRVAAMSEVRDAFWHNVSPNVDLPAGESADSYAIRAGLKYEPTDRFSALLAFDVVNEEGTPYLGANFQDPLTRQDEDGNIMPFDPNDADNPRQTYLRGMNPSSKLDHWGARAQLSYDAGPVIVDALGSFRRMRFEQVTGANNGVYYEGFDFNDANPDLYANGFWDTHSDSLIAELRAYAPDDSAVRWTVGGFYFDEQQDAFLGQVSDPANFFGGGEFNMPGVTGNSLAAYADATIDITDDFRVLVGVRGTTEEKVREGGLWSLFSGFPAPNEDLGGDIRFGTEGFAYEGFSRGQQSLPENYNTLSPDEQRLERINMFLAGIDSFGSRDTLPLYLCAQPEDGGPLLVDNQRAGSGFQCAAGANPALAENNPNIFQQVPQDNSVDATYLDWRVGVEYDLTDNSLLYSTVSTGHKSGGFNDTVPGAVDPSTGAPILTNSDYDLEQVLALEIGSKNLLADRTLKLNASAFTYLYDDYVFQTIVAAGPAIGDSQPPASAQRQNAANATIYGLDLDVTYRLPAGLEAEVHALVMDARFGDGSEVADTRVDFDPNNVYIVDIGGNWLPRASPFTLNYTLSQVLYTALGQFNWAIQGQTRGQHFMTVFNGEGNVLPPADGVDTPPETNADGGLTPYGTLVQVPNASQRLTDVVPTYTRFDVGAGWQHPDGRISINGFVNNVTNVAYATSIISTPGLNLRFFNPPRTAGVRVRVVW